MASCFGLHLPSSGHRTSHFHDMSPSDFHAFVRVLVPTHTHSLRERMQALPHHLRASGSHKSPSSATGRVHPGYLCDVHAPLKKALCYELLALVKHEITRIGQFTYPVIMSGAMGGWDKLQARQLEPVPQMWTAAFNIRDCTPEGHEPVYPGELDGRKNVFVPKWGFEASRCPACVLGRMGGDAKVLVALLAGMVARCSSRYIGPREALTSRRVQFVQCWVEACEGGEALVDQAWALGTQMRAIKRELRKAEREAAMRDAGISAQCETQETQWPASGDVDAAINFAVSTSFPPQHHQASAQQAKAPSSRSDRDTVIGFDLNEPFIPGAPSPKRSERGPRCSSTYSAIGFDLNEPFIPGAPSPKRSERGPRCSSTYSAIGVDLNEPFIPGAPSPKRSGQGPRCSSTYSAIGVDISEPFIPAATQPKVLPQPRRTTPRRTTPFASALDRPSIASSFPSNVSLSQLRAPPTTTSMYPAPLRIKNVHSALPQPHSMSIYWAYNSAEIHNAEADADVSPPASPTYSSHLPSRAGHGGHDVSPPDSPPVRPVTAWSASYK